MLYRIRELETHSEPSVPGVPYPPSSAFPRSLSTTKARSFFVSNLRQAMAEEETDDHDVDPLLTSRHVGPLARKREEDEHRERAEEEAREARRQSKRPRGLVKGKDITTQPPSALPVMGLVPVSVEAPNADPSVVVSNKGTRIRIKPPVRHDPVSSSNAVHSQSSLSPMLSPHDDQPTHYDPVRYSANGGGQHPHMAPVPGNTPPHGVPSPSLPPQMGSAPSPSSRATEVQRHAKPKRLKAHTVTSKSHSIPTVPRDAQGRPSLPLTVGIMTVNQLGEVCMREHFHTERYIFPVGYEVTR